MATHYHSIVTVEYRVEIFDGEGNKVMEHGEFDTEQAAVETGAGYIADLLALEETDPAMIAEYVDTMAAFRSWSAAS